MMARPHRSTPKPWPMKWVAAAIAVGLGLYTFFTLQFRKPGPAYRPYQDAQDRATTARLLAGGWSRMPVAVIRPVDAARAPSGTAEVTRPAAGLGPELEGAFAERPRLLDAVAGVLAPAEVPRGAEYRARFRGRLADPQAQLASVGLYRRGGTLVLIPTSEPLPAGELISRSAEAVYEIQFSTEHLPAGRYEVRLAAREAAAGWSFSVR